MKKREFHNYVTVVITTEKGFDPGEGDYQLDIEGLIGSIRLIGECSDIFLIKECVEGYIYACMEPGEPEEIPEEGWTHLLLKDLTEDGERRYEVEEVLVVEDAGLVPVVNDKREKEEK